MDYRIQYVSFIAIFNESRYFLHWDSELKFFLILSSTSSHQGTCVKTEYKVFKKAQSENLPCSHNLNQIWNTPGLVSNLTKKAT